MSVLAHRLATVRSTPWTGVEAVASRLANLDANDPMFVLHAAAEGDKLDAELSMPATLTAAAQRVADTALRLGCSAVTGASQGGDRLAAVAASLGASLPLMTPGTPQSHVLIVDTLLVTGYNLRRAADEIRTSGGAKVSACVVVAATMPDLSGVASSFEVLEP